MRSLQINEIAYKLGIRVYCNKCKGQFDPRKLKLGSAKCSHPASAQKYKSIICARKVDNKRKRMAHVYDTRNLTEVIEQGFRFKQHVKSFIEETPIKTIEKSFLVTDCLVNFIDFKRNVGVLERHKKNIQQNSFNAYENHIKKWMVATENAGENFLEMRVDKITENNVSHIISLLAKWSSSTQRKAIGFYNQFYYFLNENGYSITSPFKGIEVAENMSNDARALTMNEFIAIQKAMSQGNSNDKEKGKNKYFDWLADALTFNALTGRRREEFMNAKFSDIVLIDDQLLGGYIRMIDFKYSRQNSHKVGFKDRYTKAPIYPELHDFLMKMEYEKYKGTDRYIIGGSEIKQRNTMANNLTNGFAFYRQKAGFKQDVQLNGLRKKYITRMRNEFGDNANFFSGHKSSRIDMKHYYDDKELFEKVKSFVLWK
jgi:hypothetical protein